MHDPVLCAVREASHIAGCYERHVAGKPRVTRDLHLLDELAERLAGVQDRLAAAPRSHAYASDAANAAVRSVAEHQARIQDTRARIQDARSLIQVARAAATPAERAAPCWPRAWTSSASSTGCIWPVIPISRVGPA